MEKKKILIRAGCTPFEYLTVREVSDDNLFGNNVGNLLYAFSIFRWLMTDENVELVPDRYRPERGLCSDADIDRINQEYDRYIVPMADTFRKSFEENLRIYTQFIRKLKIPVIVIGVGISGGLETNAPVNCVPDEVVKEFLNTVLDHSAIVGLRGEHTCMLLEKLGYQEGKHITPIGCPSLYTYGERLKLSDPDIAGDKRLILTNNIFANTPVHRFIRKTAQEYPEFFYIPQRVEELRMYYSGRDMDLKTFPDNRKQYPVSLRDPFFVKGHTAFPMNIPGWMKLTKGSGMAVGPRLHGSVVSMLTGVPALLIRKDWRTTEVGEYHHIPMISQFSVTDKTRLEELAGQFDFHAPEKVHKENLKHYRDFLAANAVANIYGSRAMNAGSAADSAEDAGADGSAAGQDCVFDRKIRQAKLAVPVLPYNHISRLEQIRRNHPHPGQEIAGKLFRK